MFFAVIGHSDDIDADGVLVELTEQCREGLGDRTPQAGILFAAIDMDHELILKGVCDAWPGIELIGCTTDGEISSQLGFREDSIALMLFGSDSVEITAGIGHDVSKDIVGACGRAVEAAAAKASQAATLCLALPESLTASGQQIVEALSLRLGGAVPVFGATSGDGFQMTGTYQFYGHEVAQDSVPVLLFSGPLIYSMAVESGWEPVGEPGLVTRADGTIVHEIDGRPAIEFYRRFQGPDAVPTPECPLAILDERGEVESLRATGGVFDADTGAITYLAEIREGVMVQITVADRRAILAGCTSSIEKAFAGYPHGKSPAAALFFSCAARKLLLGTRTNEEFGIIESVIGADVPVCGFYGYGEIGPRGTNEKVSKFHNETFVSLIMGT